MAQWTGEQHALCLRLWRQGATAKEISGQVGKSAKAVWHHVRYLRDSGFDLPKRPRGFPPGYRKWRPIAAMTAGN